VIGVLVRAIRIIGDHDRGPVLLDKRADPGNDIVERDVAESLWVVPVLPLRHA